jgi:NAD(P)-dependent dehydrogenase (short-subunit alcohol dehydrogenase family)
VDAANGAWSLAGKNVIVTGASSGIGAATARELGRAGAGVLLVARDAGRLAAVAADVQAAGGRAETAEAELEDADAAAALPALAVERLGSLDGIVLTASLFDPRALEDTTIECQERQWRTNVVAPLATVRAAVEHMPDGGSIVLIGSTVASVGFPGCSAYTATKGAIASLSRALAIELAPKGIRVNLVVPGYVRTPMLQPHLDANEGYEDWILARTPGGRIGGAEDLAPSILFLLSDLSAYVDGASLVVDGGWTAQ